MFRNILFVLIFFALAASCANRFRDADTGRSYGEIEQFLRATQDGATGSADVTQALAMADDPSTAIYYAEAPGEMGDLFEVAPFYDFGFFANPVSSNSVTNMKIFYLDRVTGNGHEGALIFDVTSGGQRTVEVFTSTAAGQINDDGFSINLRSSGGQVIEFYSDDVDLENGELNSVIQGQVSTVNSGGGLEFKGKISSMVGFF